MKTVHYYFDFVSPYAYLACTQIPRLTNEYRDVARFDGHAFNMWEARLAAGNTGPSNRTIPAKFRVLMADLGRWAKRYGVPLVPPKGQDVERLNRGFLVAKDAGREVDYLLAVFKRTWGMGGDPSDQALMDDAAREAGLDEKALAQAVDSPTIIARYAEENKRARELGIFGAPMFTVDDQVYWGNDRITWVEDYLRERA